MNKIKKKDKIKWESKGWKEDFDIKKTVFTPTVPGLYLVNGKITFHPKPQEIIFTENADN